MREVEQSAFQRMSIPSGKSGLKGEGIAFRPREDSQMLTFNVNPQQLKDKRSVHELIAKALAPRDLLVSKGQASAPREG